MLQRENMIHAQLTKHAVQLQYMSKYKMDVEHVNAANELSVECYLIDSIRRTTILAYLII